mmetsp:Transcript_9078/g.13013  ORF Transcript_9078/g.13013 Transcript_9078/m.13013 type:complete len:97 (-) Transcript_9078:848-1138(-)
MKAWTRSFRTWSTSKHPNECLDLAASEMDVTLMLDTNPTHRGAKARIILYTDKSWQGCGRARGVHAWKRRCMREEGAAGTKKRSRGELKDEKGKAR